MKVGGFAGAWFDGTIFNKIKKFEFTDGTTWTAEDAEAGLSWATGTTRSGTM